MSKDYRIEEQSYDAELLDADLEYIVGGLGGKGRSVNVTNNYGSSRGSMSRGMGAMGYGSSRGSSYFASSRSSMRSSSRASSCGPGGCG